MSGRRIIIDLDRQTLTLLRQGKPAETYPVSTSAIGAGEQDGSGCTPRGKHIIRARIGAGLPVGSVLVARRPTGEIFTENLRDNHPDRDWILTRILWLSGTETSRNRLGQVDTMRRYIYIHGTPDSEAIGVPGSHGCVRMRNRDVVELFDAADVGTPVEIIQSRSRR